jgi:hypothetical protein
MNMNIILALFIVDPLHFHPYLIYLYPYLIYLYKYLRMQCNFISESLFLSRLPCIFVNFTYFKEFGSA